MSLDYTNRTPNYVDIVSITNPNVAVLTVDRQNEYVGIKNTTPSHKLDVSGDINFSGNIYNNGIEYTAPQGTLGVYDTGNNYGTELAPIDGSNPITIDLLTTNNIIIELGSNSISQQYPLTINLGPTSNPSDFPHMSIYLRWDLILYVRTNYAAIFCSFSEV